MALKTLSRLYGNLFNNRVQQRLQSRNHHQLSGSHLLITLTGRKSGKRYTIPVNYKRTDEGKFVIGTEADWWRNLAGGAEVELLVAGEVIKGTAEPILDDEERRERSGRLIARGGWFVFAQSLVVIEVTVEQ